jgi:hypothetical protein
MGRRSHMGRHKRRGRSSHMVISSAYHMWVSLQRGFPMQLHRGVLQGLDSLRAAKPSGACTKEYPNLTIDGSRDSILINTTFSEPHFSDATDSLLELANLPTCLTTYFLCISLTSPYLSNSLLPPPHHHNPPSWQNKPPNPNPPRSR